MFTSGLISAGVSQRRGREDEPASRNGVDNLLQDFGDVADIEWRLIASGAMLVLSFVCIARARRTPSRHARRAGGRRAPLTVAAPAPAPDMLVSGLVIQLTTSVHGVNPWWYRIFYACCCVFATSLVYLIEPRPMHWLPSLNRLRQGLGLGSFSDLKRRARGWWRWRKRYATRTKLNV